MLQAAELTGGLPFADDHDELFTPREQVEQVEQVERAGQVERAETLASKAQSQVDSTEELIAKT